jgi:hypothetical protein
VRSSRRRLVARSATARNADAASSCPTPVAAFGALKDTGTGQVYKDVSNAEHDSADTFQAFAVGKDGWPIFLEEISVSPIRLDAASAASSIVAEGCSSGGAAATAPRAAGALAFSTEVRPWGPAATKGGSY